MSEENLKIQLQINDALRARASIIDKQTEQLKSQVDIATKLRESFDGIRIGTEPKERLDDLKRSLTSAADEAESFDDFQKTLSESIAKGMSEADETFEGFVERLKEGTKETNVFATGAVAFVDGLLSSFKGLKASLSSILDLSLSVANGLFQVGKSILAIPFKMFNALVEEANRFQGGTELAQAFENIRKEFGNFREDVSRNVIKSARSMRGELANTGLSVYRTAGMLHERLDLLRETATEMAERFEITGNEFRMNAEVMIAYKKALGLGGEELAGFTAIAVKTNKSLQETLRTVATFSTGLGEHFGISQKLIAKDVGAMVKDLKNFGSVGIRQMAQLSVFSRKLGVSFKELLGIVDKFDNFGDAAENAARLSQAFGVNIDVMKQMNEQDPGARVENMRKAFFNAGKSIERMTRQERAYLAQTTGIEDSALDQVFALKNQKVSYDEMSKSGMIAEKQQLTTAEAMQKLAASIERIVRSGSRQGGFWDRFVLGLTIGARRAMAHDRVWRNIRRSLWQAEKAGRAVGRMFINLFPGMKQISKGFAEFFHPKKFKALRFGVVGAFQQLFKELGDPKLSKGALQKFFDNIKKAFMGMAGREESPIMKIFDGFKKAFKAVGTIFLSGAKIIIENIGKLFKTITAVVKGDMSFSEALKEQFGKAGDVGGGLLNDIVSTISDELGPATAELWGAFKELLGAAWDRATDFIGDKVSKWWKDFDILKFVSENPKTSAAIVGILFGPAFVKAGVAMLGHAVVKIFASKSLASSAEGAGDLMGKGMGKGFNKHFPTFAKANEKLFGFFGQNAGGVMSKGIATKLGAAGAIVGAAMAGWEIGKWLDDQFKISTKISEALYKQTADYQREASDILKNQNQIMEVAAQKASLGVKSAEARNALLSGEESKLKNINQVLQSNLDLDIRDQKVLLEQARLRQDILINQRLAELGEERGMTNLRGTEAIEAGKKMRKEVIEDLKKAGQIEIDPADLNKRLDSIYKEVYDYKPPPPPKEKETEFGMDAFHLLDKVKEIKPEEIEKSKKLFKEKVQPLLIGKEGISQTMTEIIKVFENIDVSKFNKIAEGLTNFAVVPRALSDISNNTKEINDEKVLKSINSITTSAFALTNLNAIPADLLKESPAISAISTMISQVNDVHKELSQINSINLKPKLQNLGKILGYGGKDTYTINNEKVKIDVNVMVTMDVDDVTKVLVESGKLSTTKTG